MDLPIYQIDAFTNQTFGGNPAAVVPLEAWLPDDVMKNIAIENNLSETAFFVPNGDGFHLRWFTPTTEVDLCGHATLATSWVIYNKLGYDKDSIHFETLSGELIVEKSGEGFTLNFPAWHSTLSTEEDLIVTQALGKAPIEVYKGKKWIAVFDDEDFIRNMTPELNLINTIDSQGLVITAKSNGEEFDFVSRYFGPQVGVPEDPVTGSAHCLLVPIWEKKLNKNTFKAHQASARGGDLDLKIEDDRVYITGEAVLYMQGTIKI